MDKVEQSLIQVTCDDNTVLAAHLYQPKNECIGAVMIAPATGIKKEFYGSFAAFLAEQGFGVITFDNRGIGASQSLSLSDNSASLQCWGEKDMPAIFNALKNYFPDTKYHLVGHSAGGQLVGLMHNAAELSSMFNFACSSGCLKNMEWKYRAKAHFFMNMFIPVNNLLFGYVKSHWVGMGEPLPKNVAKQWQQWCNGQGYVKTAFGQTIHHHLYDELELPSKWSYAIDDDIANHANVLDMISVFTKAKDHADVHEYKPKDHALNEIGHMKFFSRKAKPLWNDAATWLSTHS